MTVEICAVTPHDFQKFKSLMDISVRRSRHSSLLTTEWQGNGYRATAPGVSAFGRFDNGEVRVKIEMSFPATMMRSVILADIQRAMRESGCTITS